MSNTKFFSRKDLPKRVLSASGLNIKAKMPDYMANGIKIEIDFDAGTISYTPPKPLAI